VNQVQNNASANDEAEALRDIAAALVSIRRALLACTRAQLSHMNVIDPLMNSHAVIENVGKTIQGEV
jgi:hypothetical protein